MKTIGQEAKGLSRLIFCRLLMACVCALPVAAPGQPALGRGAGTAGAPVPGGTREVITLDGPWRFQQADDLRWADPAFDDSSWPTVVLGQPLASQGYESYTGYCERK